MRRLHSHHASLAVLSVVAISEGVHEAQVPLGYYAATVTLFLGVAAVLRGWRWVREEMQEQVRTALDLHDARDQARHAELAGQLAALQQQIASHVARGDGG